MIAALMSAPTASRNAREGVWAWVAPSPLMRQANNPGDHTMTNITILLKLEHLLDTLEGEARRCEDRAMDLTGTAAISRAGMAVAYDKAAQAVNHLIDDIRGEQQ
jgi:hypothetical protein